MKTALERVKQGHHPVKGLVTVLAVVIVYLAVLAGVALLVHWVVS